MSEPSDGFAQPSNQRLDQWRSQAAQVVNGTADRSVEVEVADAVDELVSTVRQARRENGQLRTVLAQVVDLVANSADLDHIWGELDSLGYTYEWAVDTVFAEDRERDDK